MPDTPSFVVNDRRKFTSEGELRHDAPTPDTSATTDASLSDETKGPQLVQEPVTASTSELADLPESDALGGLQDEPLEGTSEQESFVGELDESGFAAGPSAEQAEEAKRAYDATVDRLDTAMRAANPGGERMPEMTFERLVQSLYTQALMLLGGAAEPGETPRVDILGARQTIDMLSVVDTASRGNLAEPEDKLLQTALFDLRMGFLEITQALARQAAQRSTSPQGGPGMPGGMSPLGGPQIVR